MRELYPTGNPHFAMSCSATSIASSLPQPLHPSLCTPASPASPSPFPHSFFFPPWLSRKPMSQQNSWCRVAVGFSPDGQMVPSGDAVVFQPDAVSDVSFAPPSET